LDNSYAQNRNLGVLGGAAEPPIGEGKIATRAPRYRYHA
jgi:hypothetical protein